MHGGHCREECRDPHFLCTGYDCYVPNYHLHYQPTARCPGATNYNAELTREQHLAFQAARLQQDQRAEQYYPIPCDASEDREQSPESDWTVMPVATKTGEELKELIQAKEMATKMAEWLLKDPRKKSCHYCGWDNHSMNCCWDPHSLCDVAVCYVPCDHLSFYP